MRTHRTRTPGQQLRKRPHRALFGALLYALCVLVLPALHLGFHRNDHDHAGGGLRLRFAVLHDPAHGAVHEHAPGHAHAHAYTNDPDEPTTAAALVARLFPRTDAREIAAILDRGAVAGAARGSRAPANVNPAGFGRLGLNSGDAVQSGPASRPAHPAPASGEPHAGGSLAHFDAGLLPAAAVLFRPCATLVSQALARCAPELVYAQRILPAQAARGTPRSFTQRWL